MNDELRTQPRMMVVPRYEEAIQSLQARRSLVLQMMESVLQPGTHYGTIPGCGDKPSLFLAGAEQLAASFQFAPRYKKTITREDQHMTVETTCELFLLDGTFVGEGTSMCSTWESKYRYRGGVGETTGQEVPKKYWDLKKDGNMKDALAMIGGPGFTTAKLDDAGKPTKGPGKWMVMKVVEKAENPDLADQWNTVVKMGAKRAFVHAVRTATGTADVFTQDLEDFKESYGTVVDAEVLPTEQTNQAAQQQTNTQQTQAQGPAPWGVEDQSEFARLMDEFYSLLKAAKVSAEAYQTEQDLWMGRKAKDPATKVLPALAKKVAALKEAAAQSAAQGQAQTEQPAEDVTSPEFAAKATATLKTALDRFATAYAKTEPDEAKRKALVVQMRDKVIVEAGIKAIQAHENVKKLKLAEALQAKATALRIA